MINKRSLTRKQTMTTREDVYRAIDKERDHQDKKFGVNKQLSLAGFLVVLESELEEAKRGWIKNSTGRNAPLAEIVQIAAVCVGCLEKYGIEGTATVTDDISQEQQ